MKKSNNFLIFLAAFLVIALGVMAYVTYNTPQVESDIKTVTLMKQSGSDDVESIEKDLNDTDFEGMDNEIRDIDKELESPSD